MDLTNATPHRSGDTADDWIVFGCDLMDAGRLSEAAEAFEEGIARGSRWAFLNLGNALERLRQWEPAVAAFENALQAGEQSARVNLANVLAFRLFRVKEARAHLLRAWQDGDPAAAVNLAVLADAEGDLATALTWLERARPHGVRDIEARLGDVLTRLGRLEEAVAMLRAAVERGAPGARTSLGLAYRRRGDLPSALRELKRAADDGDDRAVLFVAQSLDDLGHVGEARAWFERAAAADPDTLVDYALFLEHASADPEESLRVYQRAIEAGDRRAYLNLAARCAELGLLERARLAYDQARLLGDPKAARPVEEWIAKAPPRDDSGR